MEQMHWVILLVILANWDLPASQLSLASPTPGALAHQETGQVAYIQSQDGHSSTQSVPDVPGPSLLSSQSDSVVEAMPAEDIRLSCVVKHLHNRTVSWVRHRDIHLLTSGKDSYTDDRRFSAHHPILSSSWQLRIKNVSKSDEGLYECQVSTSPPLGHRVRLLVVEPSISIVGGPDLFINQGSFINLTCLATSLPGIPTDVHWRHRQKLISFSGPRKGVSSIVEKGARTVSQLLVQRATLADSGTYTCQPTYPSSKHRAAVKELMATINLHILEGELPAAIQASPSPLQPSLPCLGLSLLTWLSQRISLNIPGLRLSIPGLSWLIWMSQTLSQPS